MDPSPTAGPVFTMRGEVLDEETGLSLPDAVVFVDGKEVSRGSFDIARYSSEEFIFRVEAAGYEAVQLAVRFNLDSSRVLNAPIPLKQAGAATPSP